MQCFTRSEQYGQRPISLVPSLFFNDFFSLTFCKAPCTTASLNIGDVFILDAGLKLFLWSGPDANMYEKSKGVELMQRIKVRQLLYCCFNYFYR